MKSLNNWNWATKPNSVRQKLSVLSILAICSMSLNGCATAKVVAEPPLHCTTKGDTFLYEYVTREKIEIFQPDEKGLATKYELLASRIDYLESFCVGINAYRGE